MISEITNNKIEATLSGKIKKYYDGRRYEERLVEEFESFLYPRDAESLYIRRVMSYSQYLNIIEFVFIYSYLT